MHFVQGDNSSFPTFMLAFFLVERFLGLELVALLSLTKRSFVQGVKRAK